MATDDPGLKKPEMVRPLSRAGKRRQSGSDLARRLAAVGLDDDLDDVDLDTFRYRLARRIDMFLNDLPGCPEKLCRRMRGCMAPNGRCENHRDDPQMTE